MNDDHCFVESDEPYQRELRLRQSRWRERRGLPMGLHRGQPLGSRLIMPDAEERLTNFLTPTIGGIVLDEYVRNKRSKSHEKKVIGYPRIFNDLLSSQPLVFNLFGELKADPEAATVAARRLWPGRVDRVTGIEFEWSPGRQDPRYLGNGTAADVALFHTTPGGGKGLICVETKYHENLKVEPATLKPRIGEVAEVSGAFRSDAVTSLREPPLQQIWFDHLLGLSVVQASDVGSALFVLLYPTINHRCADAARSYAATLTSTGAATFEARTLEDVVEKLEAACAWPWVRMFRDRYL
jgi:hypothetical protein